MASNLSTLLTSQAEISASQEFCSSSNVWAHIRPGRLWSGNLHIQINIIECLNGNMASVNTQWNGFEPWGFHKKWEWEYIAYWNRHQWTKNKIETNNTFICKNNFTLHTTFLHRTVTEFLNFKTHFSSGDENVQQSENVSLTNRSSSKISSYMNRAEWIAAQKNEWPKRNRKKKIQQYAK